MSRWRVRESTGWVGALAVVLALMVWGAPFAAAGGPTSVLVASPRSGEATALSSVQKEYKLVQKEYKLLERLLGPAHTGSRDQPSDAGLSDARQINVTWMVHDMTPWRLDRVFPLPDTDTVWIHTAAHLPESVNGHWHRAEQPGRLRALLGKLGVMGEETDKGHPGIFPAPWQHETATPEANAPAADEDSTPREPDVALVVMGGSARTRTLHQGEPGFARLQELLQPSSTGTEPVPAAWAEGRYPAVRATVLWGLTGVGGWPLTSRPPGEDVALKRQDQLIVAEDGTPWVRSDLAPDVEDDDIRWHRAPRHLYERLKDSELLGDTDRPSGAARSDSSVSLWWAVGGLAVGAGGTLLIHRAAARRGAGPPRREPRQELIDL